MRSLGDLRLCRFSCLSFFRVSSVVMPHGIAGTPSWDGGLEESSNIGLIWKGVVIWYFSLASLLVLVLSLFLNFYILGEDVHMLMAQHFLQEWQTQRKIFFFACVKRQETDSSEVPTSFLSFFLLQHLHQTSISRCRWESWIMTPHLGSDKVRCQRPVPRCFHWRPSGWICLLCF